MPDGAVEAAFEAFFAECDVDIDAGLAIRAALEAASPYIKAAALEEIATDAEELGLNGLSVSAIRSRAGAIAK